MRTTFEGAFQQVAAHVRTVIGHSDAPVPFRTLLLEIMGASGRVLAAERPTTTWPRFVLETNAVLGGNQEAAEWAAAAVELVAAAAELTDDVVDEDWTGRVVEQARALNASAALHCLVHPCVEEVAHRVGTDSSSAVRRLLASGYFAACAGEDLDLWLEDVADSSEEVALEMTWRKSGSLVAMACQVGAALATTDEAVLEGVGNFGRHVGTTAQILNDLVGLDTNNSRRGSDLRRRKKTLPVVYALRCASEEDEPILRAWYSNSGRRCHRPTTTAAEQEVALRIRDLGGYHYGWVLAQVHRQEALDLVAVLAELAGRIEVYRLCQLVPTVASRA